uniref:Uncharacterized protein n=1 Tax=Rhizophora mucronata TaxID=61149 RepID=A0A2P2IWV4_RHIMU
METDSYFNSKRTIKVRKR